MLALDSIGEHDARNEVKSARINLAGASEAVKWGAGRSGATKVAAIDSAHAFPIRELAGSPIMFMRLSVRRP